MAAPCYLQFLKAKLREIEPNRLPHSVYLYLIFPEEDVSNFLIFCSVHLCKGGMRKEIEICLWPLEIAS